MFSCREKFLGGHIRVNKMVEYPHELEVQHLGKDSEMFPEQEATEKLSLCLQNHKDHKLT